MFIRRYLVCVGIFFLIVGSCIFGYYLSYRDSLISPVYEIETGRGELNALLISDVHNHVDTFSDGNSVSNYIKEAEIDYVFLTGDLMDSHTTNFDYLEPMLEAIQDKNVEAYYVHGNHEIELGEERIAELESLLDSYGLININNKTVRLNENYTLSGVLDPSIDLTVDLMEVMEGYLGGIEGNIDDTTYNILLSHQPTFTMLDSRYGFDLVLSGHTHGGQGTLMGKALFSSSEYFHGMYTRGDFTHIVSAGVGYSYHLPLRFNQSSEIPLLRLS